MHSKLDCKNTKKNSHLQILFVNLIKMPDFSILKVCIYQKKLYLCNKF